MSIYEFQVHQQDSLVISQEITTDLTSEQFVTKKFQRQHNYFQ